MGNFRFQQIVFALFLGLVAFPASYEPAYAQDSAYETLDWLDLLPPLDLEALTNPPAYLNEIPDGSPNDVIGGEIDSWDLAWDEPGPSENDPYQAALTSTRVVESLIGKEVKLPGFVVPLEFGDDTTVTQFFLVPYFGACIHLPPPPPNQMVLVDYPEGLEIETLYDPLWISGTLNTQVVENELGTSAYSMTMDSFEVYEQQ